MKNQKKTLSIGISVYNEAETIENLLISIIRQKKNNFNLEAIYVICDGTNDGTDKIVEKLIKKFPVIRLLNDSKRKGKIKRLSELFKLNSSDIIMVLDGDVILSNVGVIFEIVKYFEKNETVLVSANNQPIYGETFIGRVINYSVYIWYLARLRFNNGDNIHNARSCCLALSKKFAVKINFPSQIRSSGRYLYLLSQQEKLKFSFAVKSIVLYREPNNLGDYVMQKRRAPLSKDKFEQIFGRRVKNKFKIPLKYKLLAVLEAFIHNPLLFISFVAVKFLIKKLPYRNINSKNTAIWETVTSTKKPIPIPF